ncbi:NADH:ubiquinone oxidoreductase subunit J [Vulcanibacillus modesticaldus]|uniref:NADH-quinone oxidoreductase subunit J n=1 Tax=Vulcanibacillus modesticaldus TaxID=337097 RepID=A0A1D2YVS3_9BACI|nr:NADH-quinone oxidoreductase subunit J [Vulcanibacillus modesticaldus]OEF99822.1 NADH:ubiquinone oxidoreductase subunit J [Vulcanibacillus modesticaldus]
MTGEYIAFFIFALMAISGAVLMLNLDRVIHMVLSIGLSFIGVAGLFVLLKAEFLAFVQILIYAGAITIMMALGTMMTSQHKEDKKLKRKGHTIFAILGATIIGLILLNGIRTTSWPNEAANLGEDNVIEIGMAMFTKHVIPFELASLLLLVALMGAIVLAKKESDK